MKILSDRQFSTCAYAMTLFLTLPAPVRSQEAREPARLAHPPRADIIKIRRVDGIGARGRVRTPSYRSDAPGGIKPAAEWAEITAYFDTEPEWIDELTFRYYVLTERTENGKKLYTLFRGTVTHVDVEAGRNHVSTMYMRPSTVKRYGRPIAIAVEANYLGKAVAEKSEETGAINLPREKWWEHPAVLESKVVTVKDGYLLNRSQTPFSFINPDDHEAIK